MFEDEIPVGRANDLRGKVFGDWTVLYRTTNAGKTTRWKCRCKCGEERAVRGVHLVTGASKNCGSCGRILDLTGQRFGRLIALEPTEERSDSSVKWLCQCDCGNTTLVSSSSLRQGHTQSCGCYGKEMREKASAHDLTNQRFGRLIALYPIAANEEEGIKYRKWHCKCDCGNETDVMTQALLKGMTTSCGCYAKEQTSLRAIRQAEDLTGQIFGKWTVLHKDKVHKGSGAYWICKCECGTERAVAAGSLKRGASFSCGCESTSKGERVISAILDNYTIPYEMQKTFSSCRYEDSKYLARFDFFVENQYLIEFDGIQHFTATGYLWCNEENLKYTQKHDAYKNQWCKDNNIPLIRIPYTKLDTLCIEDLLLETTQFRVV
jgi:hypothetical protein